MLPKGRKVMKKPAGKCRSARGHEEASGENAGRTKGSRNVGVTALQPNDRNAMLLVMLIELLYRLLKKKKKKLNTEDALPSDRKKDDDGDDDDDDDDDDSDDHTDCGQFDGAYQYGFGGRRPVEVD